MSTPTIAVVYAEIAEKLRCTEALVERLGAMLLATLTADQAQDRTIITDLLAQWRSDKQR